MVGLTCDQSYVTAGGEIGCEAQISDPASADSTEITISSDALGVMIPATIGARAGQSRVRFELTTDASAPSETAMIEARLGDSSVRQSIAVSPSRVPSLTVPGEVTGAAAGLVHFSVSATDASGLPVKLAAAALPAGATFDAGAGELQWTPGESDQGVHKVSFTATNSLGAVTSKSTELYIDSGRPVLTGLENGAGGDAVAACSPGAVASLRGRSLFVGATAASDITGASQSLGGTRVLVDGVAAAVVYASASRVDVICPATAPGAPLAIRVETEAGQSNEIHAAMQSASPGLFTLGGVRQARAIRTGSADLTAIPSVHLSGKPAMAGDVVAFQATGIDCSSQSAQSISLSLGSDLAPARSVRPLPGHAGVCEVLAAIPEGVSGDAVPVKLHVATGDGQTLTSNETTISVVIKQ